MNCGHLAAGYGVSMSKFGRLTPFGALMAALVCGLLLTGASLAYQKGVRNMSCEVDPFLVPKADCSPLITLRGWPRTYLQSSEGVYNFNGGNFAADVVMWTAASGVVILIIRKVAR